MSEMQSILINGQRVRYCQRPGIPHPSWAVVGIDLYAISGPDLDPRTIGTNMRPVLARAKIEPEYAIDSNASGNPTNLRIIPVRDAILLVGRWIMPYRDDIKVETLCKLSSLVQLEQAELAKSA